MSLEEKISSDLKTAMKAGETLRRDTLRFLQSAIKNAAIEKRTSVAEMSDEDVTEVLRRVAKQRKDSMSQYEAGGRMDLVEQEAAELAILSVYLPTSMPEDELRGLVQSALAEAGITAKADMGKAMGLAMKKTAGRATGDEVRAVVDSILV